MADLPDPFATIQRPWKEPIEYTQLVFWFVIFIIAAFAMFDGMRIAINWVTATTKEVVA